MLKDINIKVIERSHGHGGDRGEPYDMRVAPGEKSYRIAFGTKTITRLNLDKGDTILFGKVGSHIYVGVDVKRTNTYRGYTLRHTNSRKAPLQVINKDLHKQLAKGLYEMGEDIMKDGILWVEMKYQS